MHLPRMLMLAIAASGANAASPDALVYAGTYTGPDSQGIYAWRFDSDSGALAPVGLAGETENPSFLAFHPNGRFVYAVNETGNGMVTAFAVDRGSGKLTKLNSVSAQGSAPCHITVDRGGKFALVANYSSGNVLAIRIGADGRLGDSTAMQQHKGSGPNKGRQEGPHAHSINLSPDQKFAVAADLGTDRLYVYRFDAAAGTLTPSGAAEAKGGRGPRHFAFHPNGKWAYAINELDSTVTAYAWGAGELKELATAPTLPAEFRGQNTTAEVVVHPNGRFVYGSNRGHDSIAQFAVDSASGKLTPVGHTPSGGKTPRNFILDPSGRWLLAANQDSNNVVVFRVDPSTGKLTQTATTVQVSKPVCVRFLR